MAVMFCCVGVGDGGGCVGVYRGICVYVGGVFVRGINVGGDSVCVGDVGGICANGVGGVFVDLVLVISHWYLCWF